ncbi:MAG: alpha-1,2-fucosyltransferase [Candidatus Omnitrophota bacterium]
MSKVIVRIKGGLGNQLFCYTAARRLSLVNNAELVIDNVTGFARDYLYRRQYALDCFNINARKATPAERMEPFERYRRGIAKFVAKQLPFQKRHYLEQEGLDFDQRLIDYRLKNGTLYLDGLWQSENYFKDEKEIILQDLKINPPKDKDNLSMSERILARNAVAVHVRFFDSSADIEIDYYKHAIKELLKEVANPHFFLFSDKPDAAQQKIGLQKDQVTCVNHNGEEVNAYADLWLMAQCKHCIIANSTFSWWGAWLMESMNQKPIIIAPDRFPSKDTVPNRWSRLNSGGET